MQCTLLPACEYRRERWRNGRGWTREILRGGGPEWSWRCSVAEVDQDGPFSRFEGCRRLCVLLQGEGLSLSLPDRPTIELAPPHGRAELPGDAEAEARLRDGPCRLLNLLYAPTRCEASVLHRPLVGPMVFFPEPGVRWLVHVLAGEVLRAAKGPPLARAGDSLLLAGTDPTASRHLLLGAGELLLFRIRQLSTPNSEADAAP